MNKNFIDELNKFLTKKGIILGDVFILDIKEI